MNVEQQALIFPNYLESVSHAHSLKPAFHDDKTNVFLLFFEMSGLRNEWSIKLNYPKFAKIGDTIVIIISLRDIRCWEKTPKVCTGESLPVGQTSYLSQIKNLDYGVTISPILPKGLVLNMFVYLCILQHLLQIQPKGRGVILCDEVHLNIFSSEHIICVKDRVAPSFDQTYSSQLWSKVHTPQEQRPLALL